MAATTVLRSICDLFYDAWVETEGKGHTETAEKLRSICDHNDTLFDNLHIPSRVFADERRLKWIPKGFQVLDSRVVDKSVPASYETIGFMEHEWTYSNMELYLASLQTGAYADKDAKELLKAQLRNALDADGSVFTVEWALVLLMVTKKDSIEEMTYGTDLGGQIKPS